MNHDSMRWARSAVAGAVVYVAAVTGVAGCESSGSEGRVGDGDAQAEDASDAAGPDGSDTALPDEGGGGALGDAGGDTDVGPAVECDPACGADEVCVSGRCLATCPAGCDPDQACADGECIADCGADFDAQALAAGLAEDWEIVSNHCAGGAAAAFAALSATEVLELVHTPGDDEETGDPADPQVTAHSTLEVVKRSLDESYEPAVLATSEVSGPDFIAPGEFLAVSPDMDAIAYGYSDGSWEGAVIYEGLTDADIGGEIRGAGSYDAALASRETLLIDGASAGVQALSLATLAPGAEAQVRAVGTNIGSASGYVSIDGDLVLAGGYNGFGATWTRCDDGSPDGEGDRLFALSLAELTAAGEAIDVACTAQQLTIPPLAELTSGGRIISKVPDYSAWPAVSLDLAVHEWAFGGDGQLQIMSTTPLVHGSALVLGAQGVGEEGQVLIAHGHGYLLVRPAP